MATVSSSIRYHPTVSSVSGRKSSSNVALEAVKQRSWITGASIRRNRVSSSFKASVSSAKFTAWFKFGKNGMDAEGAGIYGSQARDDFDKDDVEQYFNYMGMLATEGSYDKMEELLNVGIPPVDILLLMAASEGDRPKIEELLKAGAIATVKDNNGKTALDRAADESIRQLILNGTTSNV